MCFINKINIQKQCIDNYFSRTFDKFQDTWSIPKLFQDWNLCFLISKHFQEFQDRGNPEWQKSKLNKYKRRVYVCVCVCVLVRSA